MSRGKGITAEAVEAEGRLIYLNYPSFGGVISITEVKFVRRTKTTLVVEHSHGTRDTWVVNEYGELARRQKEESYNSPHLALAGSHDHTQALARNAQWEAQGKVMATVKGFDTARRFVKSAEIFKFISDLQVVNAELIAAEKMVAS